MDTPQDLGPSGRALWDEIVGEFELRTDELAVLAEAARASDELDELRGMAAAAKTAAAKRQALVQTRQHRIVFGRLLRQLDLAREDPDEPKVRGGMETTEKARRAAHARWEKEYGRPTGDLAAAQKKQGRAGGQASA